MRIGFNSNPTLLDVLRAAVKFRARESGFPETVADQVALAVHEAAANVIQHTYQNRHDGRLELYVQTYSDRMEFLLEDAGPKAPAEVRSGSKGTQRVRQVMDTCDWDETFPGGNRLRMVKRFTPRSSA